MSIQGYIHSIESLGAVDGPGVRTVCFLQGCSLRCAYCHNPDTWKHNCGELVTSSELLERVLRYRPFFGKEGGVTLSGGEPLLQAAFSADLLKQCQEAGVHTALDTAGSIFHEDVTNVLNYSDLVILDVKHTDPLEYKKLTGGNYSVFEQFLDHCIKIKKPLWLRQVIVPGFTDGIDNIRALANLAKKAESRKVELLPYHDMGKYKWNQLGISYALDRITPPSDATMQELKKELLDFL